MIIRGMICSCYRLNDIDASSPGMTGSADEDGDMLFLSLFGHDKWNVIRMVIFICLSSFEVMVSGATRILANSEKGRNLEHKDGAVPGSNQPDDVLFLRSRCDLHNRLSFRRRSSRRSGRLMFGVTTLI